MVNGTGRIFGAQSFFFIGFHSVLQLSSNHLQCTLTQPAFTLRWIHSVEKELWQENFQISGQQLLLTSTQFKTFGAGTPSNGKGVMSKEGWLHYSVELFLPALNWVVSSNVESTLITEQGQWLIFKDFDDYSEIKIQVIRLPLWQYFIQESCDDYFEQP